MFKKNTAVTGFSVGLVSATDGSDITTGTPVGYYTLDGGTQTAIADVTPVHEGNGLWSFDLTAGEMNGDIVALTFTHASAITQHFTIKTVTKLTSELNDIAATAIVSAGAITTLSGAVVNVDTVDTCTTNTDMRGTDNAALATALSTAQNDLDIITGTNGVLIDDTEAAALVDAVYDEPFSGHNTAGTYGRIIRQTAEGIISEESTVNDASATTTSFVTALTEATDSHYGDQTLIFIDGALKGQCVPIASYNGTTKTITLSEALTEAPANGDGFIILALHVHPIASIQSGLATEAKQDQIIAVLPTSRVADDVTFSGGTTTTAVLVNVDGAAASSTDDVYNSRILLFDSGTLDKQVAVITDYVGATKTATISAVTTAVTGSHTAKLI